MSEFVFNSLTGFDHSVVRKYVKMRTYALNVRDDNSIEIQDLEDITKRMSWDSDSIVASEIVEGLIEMDHS